MKIWHISDTHGHHNLLIPPERVDMVIHSGDCSNYKDVARNSVEVEEFLNWFHGLEIKNKIYVAGNHDSSIENGLISRERIERDGTIYLYNERVNVENLSIWGSPYTPRYGDWSFMKKRGKLSPIWDMIPDKIDILITHGPPKGVLDLTFNESGDIERAGCKELWNAILDKQPRYNLFGHIHNCGSHDKLIVNQGTLKLHTVYTTFCNGSVVHDGKFGAVTNHGQIIEI